MMSCSVCSLLIPVRTPTLILSCECKYALLLHLSSLTWKISRFAKGKRRFSASLDYMNYICFSVNSPHFPLCFPTKIHRSHTVGSVHRFSPGGHHSEGVQLLDWSLVCTVSAVSQHAEWCSPSMSEGCTFSLFLSLCCHTQILLLPHFSSHCLSVALFNDCISLSGLKQGGRACLTGKQATSFTFKSDLFTYVHIVLMRPDSKKHPVIILKSGHHLMD